ncbi:unnamed protein product [Gongylonema pulchrum]|uniref:NR LBD domain-containing protein n=1 Tax=Gongylonema pulchrum TaxID=637853 RepID=A0A183EJX0_9BILA|nr:unnamed protein product [Gongylonema pulchrum]
MRTFQISFQEFSLCRKWLEGLFDTDIFKLNHAVVLLCLSLGIEPSHIDSRRPLANLLLLSQHVSSAEFVAKVQHHTLTAQLADSLEADLRKISWAERERAVIVALDF